MTTQGVDLSSASGGYKLKELNVNTPARPSKKLLTESPAAAGRLLDHDPSTDDVSELGEEAE